MNPNLFLKRVLLFDAATCAAMGLLLAFGAGLLARILAIDIVLLRETGIFLVAFALFVLWAAGRLARSAVPAEIVVATNIAWVIASILFVIGPWAAPNLLGTAFVAAQAAAVAGIAALQGLGLRRARLQPR